MLSRALREAASAGDALQADSLIRQGARIDAADSAGKTALMLAAVQGHTATVEKLLALGAHRTLVDREGLNAAQQARRAGYARIADLIDGPS
ncbi:MAG: ankyrin repeat domain-containing protein [Acidovorax sp.]|nr:MAG: ankyrin repeat domain-containing protein [Acidovorax sp.]